MKYQAFTNDSLAMMHHGARGALAVDDELSKLGEQPRFKVRTTLDWAEHAADLEAEMVRRGMSFEAIDLSAASAAAELVAEEPVAKEPVTQEPVATAPGSDLIAAEPDSPESISSELAPTAPVLASSAAPESVPDSQPAPKTAGNVDNAADHDTRLRSRIAAVLKIRS